MLRTVRRTVPIRVPAPIRGAAVSVWTAMPPVYGSTVQAPSLWAPGRRRQKLRELLDLLVVEVRQEHPLDARDVGASGFAQLVVAEIP